MSFNRNPIVDDNSERSEESVLICKTFFTRKNKFISREEIPDYGVDLDIELINEFSEASGRKFPIQIKSTQSINVVKVDNAEFISFQFKTSRLGYLSRRIPGYGLVILYCENNKNLYYDFTENIISRIQRQRENDDWKEQKTVNIHIPLENIVNEKSINSIYEKFVLKFENFEYFISQYPEETIDKEFLKEKANEFISLADLEEFGYILVNDQEFHLLQTIFSILPSREIIMYPKVCLYAALCYSETGYAIESIYYLYQCRKYFNHYNEVELELIQIVEPKVKFLLGEMTFDQYGNRILELTNQMRSSINQVNTRLNLFQYRLVNVLKEKSFNAILEEELVVFFDEIQELEIKDNRKSSLIVHHCQTVSSYATFFISHVFFRNKIREELGSTLPDEEKIKSLKRYLNLSREADKHLHYAYKLAKELNDGVLESEVLMNKARIFLNKNLNLFFIKQVEPLSEDLRESYKWHMNAFLQAYNGFAQSSRLKEAHLSLNLALDLSKMFSLVYSEKLEVYPTDKIRKLIKEIELQTGLKPHESIIEDALNHTLFVNNGNFHEYSSELPEEKLEELAREIILIYSLPEDRYINVLNDMLSYRKFDQICKNRDVELLQDLRHTQSLETKYKYPCKYILRSKKTGIQTPPSENIDELLEMFSNIISRKE